MADKHGAELASERVCSRRSRKVHAYVRAETTIEAHYAKLAASKTVWKNAKSRH
jgi:hypothetical protein